MGAKYLPRLLVMVCLGVLAPVLSCVERWPTIAPPRFEIQDAVHSSGNKHFFFLPPLVSQATYSGAFDTTVSPVVEICEWAAASCAAPLLAQYTLSTGTGSETIRLLLDQEVYVVNWHTDQFNLDVRKTYRIRVRVATIELGHADVDVVSSTKELKAVQKDFVPLLIGRTLPIKFRIEHGALCSGAVDCADQEIGPAGGALVVSSGLAGVQLPDGALNRSIRLVVRRKSDGDCTPVPVPGVGPCYEVLTDQPAGFTLLTPATVGVCAAEPAATAELSKFDPGNPTQGVITLSPAPVPFLDCTTAVGEDARAAGGLTRSFSDYVPTKPAVWGFADFDDARGSPSVTPLFLDPGFAIAPNCFDPSVKQVHTGQNAARVLVAGGVASDGSALATVYELRATPRTSDPEDGVTLSRAWYGRMNTARWGHTATQLLDGRVLIVGGIGAEGTILSDAEVGLPGLGFHTVGPMSVPRYRHTATLLVDGRVLITGGQTTSSHATELAEIFDPVSETFTPTGSMSTPRSRHRATLIPPTGAVLITGGEGSGGNPPAPRPVVSASMELFYPSVGRFIRGAAMRFPRRSHTATYLPKLSSSPLARYILVAGGTDGTVVHEHSELVVVTGTSDLQSVLPQAMPGVQGHQAVITGGCNVLITGGTTDQLVDLPSLGGKVPSSMALWFDATALPGHWYSVTNMLSPRTEHRVVNLVTNRFLLLGGFSRTDPYTGYFWSPTIDVMAWSGAAP